MIWWNNDITVLYHFQDSLTLLNHCASSLLFFQCHAYFVAAQTVFLHANDKFMSICSELKMEVEMRSVREQKIPWTQSFIDLMKTMKCARFCLCGCRFSREPRMQRAVCICSHSAAKHTFMKETFHWNIFFWKFCKVLWKT